MTISVADTTRSTYATWPAEPAPGTLAFHQAIVALLDSTRLDDFFAAMTKELRFYLTVLSKSETPDEVVADHRRILDAIRAGDRDRAVAEIRSHVDTSVQRLVRMLAG